MGSLEETHGTLSLTDTLKMMKLKAEEERGFSISMTTSQVFFHLLERCISQKSIENARAIHCLSISFGLDTDAFLVSHLIRMFAFFTRLPEAKQVFNKLAEPNVFSWNAIISAHVKLGHNEMAINLYHEMLNLGIKPNGHVFVEVLKALSYMGDLDECKIIHGFIVESGFELDVYIANTLIDIYGNCRSSLDDAFRVFSRLEMRDIVSWNTLIMACSRYGYVEEAFCLFKRLSLARLEPNHITFLSILKGKSLEIGLNSGMQIHAYAIQYGLESNRLVGNSLISMYVNHCSFKDACLLSEKLPKRNHVTYNTLIAGCAQYGYGKVTLQLFLRMIHEGIEPDCYTFVSFLKGYARLGSLNEVMWAYSYIVEGAFEVDNYIASTLVSVLMKHGKLDDAQRVFDLSRKENIVIWSALIDGYVQSGCTAEAFNLFDKMKHQHGMNPGPVTYASLLKACPCQHQNGKWIHSQIIEDAIESDQFVASSLIDMYVRCDNLKDACIIFERLDHCNIVVCSALIIGLTRQGHGHKALMLFDQMRQQNNLYIDEVAYVNIINACSEVSALVKGRQAHAHIIENGLLCDSFVGSSLIDMYSNCWSLEDACKVFSTMPKQDTITWNAMIAGCFQCNRYELAWRKYEEMQHANMEPDNVTFLSLLSGCSNQGLVVRVFKSMREYHGLEPTIDHCNCIADLLGRIGDVEEAEDVLKTGESGSNIIGWTSLLSHCRAHSNMEVGLRCFHRVVVLDPKNSKGYILMSNIFANAGRPNDAEIVEQLRYCGNAWNKPGNAFIMIENKVHSFLVGEQNHLSVGKLKNLSIQMLEEGYMPSLELAQTLACDDDMHCCFD